MPCKAYLFLSDKQCIRDQLPGLLNLQRTGVLRCSTEDKASLFTWEQKQHQCNSNQANTVWNLALQDWRSRPTDEDVSTIYMDMVKSVPVPCIDTSSKGDSVMQASVVEKGISHKLCHTVWGGGPTEIQLMKRIWERNQQFCTRAELIGLLVQDILPQPQRVGSAVRPYCLSFAGLCFCRGVCSHLKWNLSLGTVVSTLIARLGTGQRETPACVVSRAQSECSSWCGQESQLGTGKLPLHECVWASKFLYVLNYSGMPSAVLLLPGEFVESKPTAQLRGWFGWVGHDIHLNRFFLSELTTAIYSHILTHINCFHFPQ